MTFTPYILFVFAMMPFCLPGKDVSGSFHPGDPAGINRKAHGVPRKQEHIAVIIEVAGIGSGGVESRNRPEAA